MSYSQPVYSEPSFHHHAGYWPYPAGHAHHAPSGFCVSCCHPRSKCCCGHRECRKEAKELLVEADTNIDQRNDTNAGIVQQVKMMTGMMTVEESGTGSETTNKTLAVSAPITPLAGKIDATGKAGTGKAFIGGGCCVHLSIEYTPTNAAATASSLVVVMVQDSENTTLAWMKQARPEDGYQIKECIVTTKPGAHLTVLVLNMTARVRWCEVFSC